MVFEGYREEVEAQRRRALAEAIVGGGADLGPTAAEHYWNVRHAVAERWRDRMKALRPTERWENRRWRSADYVHVSLPISRVVEYKRFADKLAASRGLHIREAGIWTNPQLFSVFIMDPNEERAAGKAPPLWKAIDDLLEKALEFDGGVEYCHGLGTKLESWAPLEWGEALPLARRLKRAVDPNGVLNPGKLGL
jgi:FAD/FMN-containing dehydrogenase